jgi:hypothetical protein
MKVLYLSFPYWVSSQRFSFHDASEMVLVSFKLEEEMVELGFRSGQVSGESNASWEMENNLY